MIGWLKSLATFPKKRRSRRYVLNVQRDMPLEYLLQLLQLHTPILGAKDYNKLPAHLKALFVPARKV